MNGFLAVLRKEFSHIRRERSTLVFAFLIPVAQLILFGYAIDTKVENVATVVLDLDGRADARQLVEKLQNSRTFRIRERVFSDDEFEHALTSGRAQVGVRIPPDYTERRLRGVSAPVQFLIDGSNSTSATAALSTAQMIGIQLSLQQGRAAAEALQAAAARDDAGNFAMPVDVRTRLLYNPDLESAFFFVPALVGIILQNVTIFLTAFAITRERELGTLEQLFVTPVGRMALLLGKLIPYTVIGFVETLLVLVVMVFLFGVPIAGNLFLLLALSTLFLITALGLGLLISTAAQTQLQAMQLSFLVLLPSILLSGFVFPRYTMPTPLYLLGYIIPVTYFLEILRGIILRAATFRDLLPHVAGLSACCAVILGISLARFRKQIS